MTKQQSKKFYARSKFEQRTLIICFVIILIFVLGVSIGTQGSLMPYTSLHALLALLIVPTILLEKLPQFVVWTAIALGAIGAISALGLVTTYLPYYMEYLNQ